jgi:Na+-translocating ferredoxin:NAD+ oxidoreductase RnfG subunit
MLHVACSTEYFPLTLTLGERERQASGGCLADGCWANSGTGVIARRWIWTNLLLATFWLAGAGVALAEHYLSMADAQKICFPNADKFETQQLRLSADQIRTIEQKSGVKVRKTEVRFTVAQKNGNTIGVLMVDHVVGKHELIDYAVAISPEGKVLQVEILEYREHYGGEIRHAKWREQFKGKTAASKLKLNEDIYNISGATISCRNVTDGVRRVLATYEVVVRPQLVAGGRLPDTAIKP